MCSEQDQEPWNWEDTSIQHWNLPRRELTDFTALSLNGLTHHKHILRNCLSPSVPVVIVHTLKGPSQHPACFLTAAHSNSHHRHLRQDKQSSPSRHLIQSQAGCSCFKPLTATKKIFRTHRIAHIHDSLKKTGMQFLISWHLWHLCPSNSCWLSFLIQLGVIITSL